MDKFLTQVLLHGFKGFKNMTYFEIEFFLHQHKWVKANNLDNKTLNKQQIKIKEENNED
tara:strand:- start:361 stop:537 length:177 start_codon:yes stop_codon:yes gene_type:complete